MPDKLIEIRNAVKSYHSNNSVLGKALGLSRTFHALNNVSLDIYRGETLGLVGESGSGKSTLARCLMHLEPLTSGELLLDGREIDSHRLGQFRRKAQIVFQDPHSSLNRSLRVGKILASPLELKGKLKTTSAIRARVRELLVMVGLPESFEERWPHQLSGGQRQRIGIARALAMEPELIVLDEPTSALDVSIQAQVVNLLAALQDRLSLTYLFISHDLNLVRYLSDRVAVMKEGSVVEIGNVEDVYSAPRHEYTRTLLKASTQVATASKA